MRKEKGITLIALVITIILILILVGVSVNVAFGENGIIKKAREAGDRWKEEQFREQVIADVAEAIAECYEEGNEHPTLDDIIEKLEDKGYTVTDNEDGTITVEKDGGTATIDEDFNVKVEEVPSEEKTPDLMGWVSYSTQELTNQPVLVTLTTNREIIEPSGWTKVDETTYTREYTINVTETITIEDLKRKNSRSRSKSRKYRHNTAEWHGKL